MDQTREKRSHQSKFVKLLCYYTIVVTLQIRSQHQVFLKRFIIYFFSLTLVTLVMTGAAGGTITMIDTEGYSHPISSSTVFATLGIGWAAFVLSLVFNILYYALHPSQVTLIPLICLQSPSPCISPPGCTAGYHREAGSGCGWIRDQSGYLYHQRFVLETDYF